MSSKSLFFSGFARRPRLVLLPVPSPLVFWAVEAEQPTRISMSPTIPMPTSSSIRVSWREIGRLIRWW
jgi:hypothetical protein